MKVALITGGTGLLGMRLSFILSQAGFEVRHLSRNENLKATYPAYAWDLKAQTIDLRAFENVHSIIHLAGANLADGRWTAARKKVLIDSRVESTQLLAQAIQDSPHQPKHFIACSAVGFYGNQADQVLTEESPLGADFMSEICKKWEDSSDLIRQLGIRTAIVRVGVVLSTQGGALAKLKLSYPFRVAPYFGDGQQYYSWIHLDDICAIFKKAILDESMTEIYNGGAPNPVTLKELMVAIAKAYDKKCLHFPIPSFLAKMVLGEMSSILLNSTRAIPKALEAVDFQFQHPDLVPALKDLLERKV